MDHSDATNSAFFPFFIGDLLGYKIFYYSVPVNSRNAEEIEVVSASHTTHSLIFLEMYTNYSISILAFNPAGEGPRSDPVSVKTLQGIPEPPVDLKFNEITMNTLKVSWDPPVKPNGEILGYVVAYETAEQDESKCSFSIILAIFDVIWYFGRVFAIMATFCIWLTSRWRSAGTSLSSQMAKFLAMLWPMVAAEQDESKCYCAEKDQRPNH